MRKTLEKQGFFVYPTFSIGGFSKGIGAFVAFMVFVAIVRRLPISQSSLLVETIKTIRLEPWEI